MRLSSYTETINIADNKYIISLITGSVVGLAIDENIEESVDTDNLVKNGILTKLSFDEEKSFVNDLLNSTWNNEDHKIAVTIAPTLNCNLACPYCYERDAGVHTQKEKISHEDMNKIIDFLNNNKINNIALYGGEPLLKSNTDVLKPLFKYIKNSNGQINATTNGTQINYYKEYLGPKCISEIQITLDGLKDDHNNLRFTKSGRGTYDLILDNIDMALNKKCNVKIRMNTNQNNYESCIKEKENIISKFKNDRLHIYLAPIRGDLASFEYAEKDTLCHPSLVSLENFILKDKSFFTPVSSFCATTSKSGSVVFAPNGVWNCWHFVGQETAKVSDYQKIDSFNISQEYLAQFNEPCLSCKYILICSGGCVVDNDYGACNISQKHIIYKNNLANIISQRIGEKNFGN